MRYIDPDEIEELLPDEWAACVTAAKQFVADKLAAATTKAVAKAFSPAKTASYLKKVRSLAISTQGASTWRSLASRLALKTHDKCWYCETLQERSDMAVDHFRPKNKVEECSDHPGYHWLAFDWRNFRYTCTYCNSKRTSNTSSSGGKQCHFPLLNEGSRARSEADRWEQEEVEILDPYVRTDVKLLTFIETGEPWPANGDETSTDYRRAATSIRVYHLDEAAVNRKRKRIRIQIRNWIAEIEKDPDSHELLKREILRRIRESAEYSTAARIYLRAYRSKPWVTELLEQV